LQVLPAGLSFLRPAPAIPATGPASSGLQLKLGGWYGTGVRAPRRFERSHAPFTTGSRASLFPPPPRRPSSLRSHFPARLASSGLGSPLSPRSQAPSSVHRRGHRSEVSSCSQTMLYLWGNGLVASVVCGREIPTPAIRPSVSFGASRD
jgi:hypothetical protein